MKIQNCLTYKFSKLGRTNRRGSWSEDKFFKLLLFRNLYRQQENNSNKNLMGWFDFLWCCWYRLKTQTDRYYEVLVRKENSLARFWSVWQLNYVLKLRLNALFPVCLIRFPSVSLVVLLSSVQISGGCYSGRHFCQSNQNNSKRHLIWVFVKKLALVSIFYGGFSWKLELK